MIEFIGCSAGSAFQNYVRSMLGKDNINFRVLPLKEFPNGAYWMKHSEEIKNSAFVVHFTHLKGKEKQQKMRQYEMWNPNSGFKHEL